ncbi:MAG: glycosyltransferase [Clostridia bacterium]|nr:glycosyltransferase [Clostridia bacterium]
MMKILQISKYYSPFIGGVEQVAKDCSDSLKNLHDVKVFCFNHEKGDDAYEIDGIEVVRAGCYAKIASQSLSFSYCKNLKKIFKNYNPDIVIFHYPNPFAAHYLLKILKRYPDCKLVLYWHLDIVKQKILGKLFNGQTKRLIKRATKILATSPNYIDGSKFLREYKEKCEVLSCCVNAERLSVSDADIALSENIREKNIDKTICFAVGRHVQYKGMEYLVRAGRYLDDNIKIFIGGEGPLTESLKELAKNDDKICFLGKLNENDLKGYLLSCDIFCFPSVTKNEAFGIALAEAMCLGKPAITFTIPGSGVNYVSLNGVTGLEVENGNIEKYAEAIKRLADDSLLRKQYGNAAKSRVEILFTQKGFEDNLRRIINSI